MSRNCTWFHGNGAEPAGRETLARFWARGKPGLRRGHEQAHTHELEKGSDGGGGAQEGEPVAIMLAPLAVGKSMGSGGSAQSQDEQ